MANSPKYISYPIVANARDLIQRSFDFLRTKITGWEPSEGQLDTWILEATGNEGADIATLTTEVPKSIFRYLGATLFGIPALTSVSATATSTWFLSDAAGHTIPAGTQVSITDLNGSPQPFTVLSDVIVPGGATQTVVGGVVLIATNAGIESSGIGTIGGLVQLQDILAWVDHIVQETVTAGGQDAELDDDYLTRLSLNLQMMTPRPILPNDFAILARNVAGVQRAAAIDGYNPGDGSFNNERMVTVVSLDALGAGVSAPVKTAVAAYLNSLREINFVVNTANPSTQQVDVTTHFKTSVGYSITDTASRVTTAINTFLDPRYWGVSKNDNPNDPKTWNNISIVRYLEIATIINNVPGVDVITELLIGPHSGVLAPADLSLTGVIPLPSAGTITVVGS